MGGVLTEEGDEGADGLSAPGGGSTPGSTTASRLRDSVRRWAPGPMTAVALVGAVLFVVIGIGGPLLGRGVFAGTDLLTPGSPYRDTGLAGTIVQNTFVNDTVDAELPAQLLFAGTLRWGEPAQWNPYVAAGTPLGVVPNQALLSPLALPFYVMPGWLAPAYEKLAELAVTIVGCYLFLRRLRVRPAAAIVAGTIFASSAFLVMWTNWPQARVAAGVGWLFWAVERLVARRRVVDGVVLALPVAGMLLGGFPAVTGFALLTAGAYLVVRLLAEHPHEPRRVAGLLGAGVAAVAGGAALAAVQLLPFATFYRSWFIDGRDQQPGDHLSLADLATSFAPWVFGGVSQRSDQPFWYLSPNLVEASSFVGAAALVLVVTAVAGGRWARAVLPRGTWTFFVVSAGVWFTLIYLGGPLRIVQHLPLFDTNFVGRARSVFGFLLAVLAGVGLEIVLKPQAEPEPMGRPGDKPGALDRKPRNPSERFEHSGARNWPTISVVVACLIVFACVLKARAAARAADVSNPVRGTLSRLAYADSTLRVALLLVASAVAAVAVLLAVRTHAGRAAHGVRLVALVALVALVVGQGLSYVRPYWPRAERSTFYPVTDSQSFLQANLGEDRYVGTSYAMTMGVDAQLPLRGLAGHTFLNANLAALVQAVPGDPVTYPTHLEFQPRLDQARSPILDRLAARYFVISPKDTPFGTIHLVHGDGGSVPLTPGAALIAAIPGRGPLRGVGVTPLAAPPGDPNARITATVYSPGGAIVATGWRIVGDVVPGRPLIVPVTAEGVAAGTPLTVTVATATRLRLATNHGHLAVSTVAPAADGLRLVHAGSSVIYQRLTALARIRWADTALVQPDQTKRIALLASGRLPADTVVLNAIPPGSAGRPSGGRAQPGQVTVTRDDPDAIDISTHGPAPGYVVVADALQTGWAASVDGRPATLVAADQGVVAVPVGAGEHTVELRYAAPYHGAGSWITLGAALLAVALLMAGGRAVRRQPRRTDPPPRNGDLARR